MHFTIVHTLDHPKTALHKVGARLRAIPGGCGFQPQKHRLEAGATTNHRPQAGSYN
jgi:hypothetical protein